MNVGTELKPCPFCGGGASYVKHEAGMRGTQGFDRWDAVACRSCGGTIGACDRRFRDKGDAAAAWNRRAPHTMELAK
jgi:Lar family restriction alleviation protein